MDYLSTQKADNILIATLNQPGNKVNKLDEKLVSEFRELMDRVEQEDVRGMVLVSGKEHNFIAGADVEMLQHKNADEITAFSRKGNELLLRLEHLNKPVVAAIHGSCLGGGLEVAMACHYRVLSNHDQTVLGQPESQLGLLPGGGGTQRLPRLIGIQNALPYLLTGKNIYPHKAHKLGLVDELVHRDAILTAAKTAVHTINQNQFERDDKRSLLHQLLEGLSPLRKIIYSQARKKTQSNTRGNYPAPPKIIDTVETGTEEGMREGLRLESENFGLLAGTAESQAMVNLFFGMQKAKKNPAKVQAVDINKIGVIGAGLMGAGIAQVSASKGDCRVLLKDQNAKQALTGEKHIWQNLQQKHKKHIISRYERDRTSSLVTATGKYDGFENTDLIIEAVFEDLDLKRSILEEVEPMLPENAIWASNTSSLPIKHIAKAAERPEQVVGMHYFSPVPKMPLMELIKTEQTADWVTASARQAGLNQGKHVIVVNDGPGFYTTRILAPYMNEALMLLEEGITIKSLDKYMKDFGFPVGPAALFDEVGIDVSAHITEVLNELFTERGFEPSDKPTTLFEDGYKGKKNKKGFYKYKDEKGDLRKQEPDTSIYQYFGGTNRSAINKQEVQRRMMLMMVNEAAWCLQDGILQNPTDGDLGAVLGLGFPPFLGGPFRYIDREGAGAIVNRLENLYNKEGPRFKPADILRHHASSEETFHSD